MFLFPKCARLPTETSALIRQGWISLAAWIAFGILIEGLIGFRIPALLDDPVRREMFRLAHAHGTLLNLVLIAAAICARLELIRLEPIASLGLRSAVILLPVGISPRRSLAFQGRSRARHLPCAGRRFAASRDRVASRLVHSPAVKRSQVERQMRSMSLLNTLPRVSAPHQERQTRASEFDRYGAPRS